MKIGAVLKKKKQKEQFFLMFLFGILSQGSCHCIALYGTFLVRLKQLPERLRNSQYCGIYIPPKV